MIVMGVCLFSTLNRCALNCWLLLLISQFHNHINQVGVSSCVGYVSQHLAKLKEGRWICANDLDSTWRISRSWKKMKEMCQEEEMCFQIPVNYVWDICPLSHLFALLPPLFCSPALFFLFFLRSLTFSRNIFFLFHVSFRCWLLSLFYVLWD